MESKICTSIDQSKKLIELGIDINTADLTVTNYPLQDGSRFDFICCKLPNDTFPSITDGKSEKIPAWSLTALLELLPSDFDVKGEFGTSNYQIHPRKYRFSADIDVYQIAYGSHNKDGVWRDMINTPECENFVDAVFQMICWLKENKKI